MKTLIINGSPRKNGDTASLISELQKYLEGEVVEISAYRDNIKPCVDCRKCWTAGECPVNDDMKTIYDGDYDNVVIASPVHMFGLPGPLISLAGRFQMYYAAKYFAKKPVEVLPKKGALILVGGGDGDHNYAIKIVKIMLSNLGAKYDENLNVLSLNTNSAPASQDEEALQRIRNIANELNKSKEETITKSLERKDQ